MALLFQSNPDQWEGRTVDPGATVRWYVSRYGRLMRSGEVVLLWEAQGHFEASVRGLYGWGLTTDEPTRDSRGDLRVPVLYVERWVAREDANVPAAEHRAPMPTSKVLGLPSWGDHLLSTMPVGANFLVTEQQLWEVAGLAAKMFPDTQLVKAAELDAAGQKISVNKFKAARLVGI